MKRKIIALCLAWIAVVGVCFGSLPAAAFSGKEAEDALARCLLRYGAADAQTAANTLAASPGNGEEWLALALCRSEADCDLAAYGKALEQALPGLSSPTDTLRAALALSAIGENQAAAAAAEEAMGQRGIMSWIYGLLVLDSRGYESSRREEAVTALLQMQKADGGWCLSGEHGDTDVTAMTLQALAPYTHNAQVAAAVESGLARLSALQGEDGGFASYGVANAESCAQVLLALNALGIPYTDERFVQTGGDPLSALLSYRTAEGGFSHTAGGAEDPMATTQAMLALLAVQLSAPFYRFADGGSAGVLPPDFAVEIPQPEGETVENPTPTPAVAEDLLPMRQARPVKFWILLGAAGLWVLCLAVALLRRRGKRTIVSTVVLGAAALVLLWAVPIETPAEYAARQNQGEMPVTVSIHCENAGDLLGQNGLPQNGVLLPETTVYLPQGATVFDALQAAAAKAGLTVDHSGLSGQVYVRGIAGLYEFDAGELSGWMFLLNGEAVQEGCGSVEVTANDNVYWVYTADLGKDIAPPGA